MDNKKTWTHNFVYVLRVSPNTAQSYTRKVHAARVNINIRS